ncbi:hypothetical protein UB45_13235 [Terrabacter sp. 28]|nr:hypothetical protein UB45_13235 [Terrabacter sp. 28]
MSVSVTMPVTLLAAEKEPMSSGRCAYAVRRSRRTSRSTCPSRSCGMTTTSATHSRHMTSFEWCS